MRDVLIVVDMQKDFIDGSLGTAEAVAIVENVKKKIEEYEKAGKKVYFTADTHFDNYMETFEGRHLPVKHCIEGEEGWKVAGELRAYVTKDNLIKKLTFGYVKWDELLGKEAPAGGIELCGLCTDICVISNALILRAFYPETDITVDSACCAGVTVDKHNAALEVMRSCQIEVI